MKVRLYYANELIKEWNFETSLRTLEDVYLGMIAHEILHRIGAEFYNGGYLRVRSAYHLRSRPWLRCDFTPVLDEDLPKGIRMLDLIMGD